MTWSEGWALRAEGHRAADAWPFAVCLAVVVVLAWVGQLTRWAIREGWYRPLLAATVAVSTLAALGIGPLAAAITLLVAACGRLAWRVNRFGRASTDSVVRRVVPILFTLSRAEYRKWLLKRRWRLYAAPFLRCVDGLTGEPPRPRQWQVHSPVRSSCVVNVATTGRNILDDLAPRMGTCAQTLRLHSASVEPVHGHPGLARFTWYHGSLLDEVQDITVLPEPKPGWAWFGLGADGEPAGTRIDLSTLYVGESRSGKSTAMWGETLSMIEQEQIGGMPIEFWIIDLARTEFAAARPLTQDDRPQFANPDSYNGYRYAITNEQANGLLRMAWEEADRRANLMADNVRKVEPSQDMPQIVIIIDELLRVIEKKGGKNALALGNEAEGLIRMILTQAAKFGIVIKAGTQASKVDVLTSIRDWFQQRVAFSTATPHMTDCALGDGAHAVAECDKLNVHRDAGKGWMHLDGTAVTYAPFRGVWIDDRAIRDIGKGRVPDKLLVARGQATAKSRKPGAVYIFWSGPPEDPTRECLYVGKTDQARPEVRWRRHLWGVDEQDWASLAGYVEVRRVKSARQAEKMERVWIRELDPLGNRIRYEQPTDYERELTSADR